MGRGPGITATTRMWFTALLVLATLINETSQISKNFVNSSMPELRPTFVVNFDMSTVICQHSSDPSDLHLHEMSILCDGKDDCFTNPAMHDESFPYCERKCNSTCNNRGACLYDGEKPQCYCNSGFSGAMCEIVDENECLDRPCHLMAHCQNTPGAYECKCFPGFTGDGHQCFDIDECYENPKICPENSKCVNLPGTFYCNCTEGYQQKGESLHARCVDVNECETGLHNCGENQMCENTIGGFTCVAKCSKGYEFVNNECVDINECRLENTCDPRAECTNTPGGFECACEPGMSGDGKNCQPLTDCSQREDICDRHALCLPALKMCYCRSGYAGDGITCHDINECEAMENPCESQGDKRCVNVDGGYICCDNEQEDQRCIQEQGAFCSGGCGLHAYCANATCQCLPGYIGDPQKKCLDVDECESDKMCPGVGQWCVNSLGGFLCCGPDSKEVECQGAHIFKTHDGATAILHTNSSANEQWAQKGETVHTASGGQIVIGQGVLRANGSIPSISIQSKLPCTSYCPSNSECVSGFCECLKGFGGNPHFGCEDVDECALGTSACPEDKDHWCVNTEGSFTCCNVNSTQTDCQGIEIVAGEGLRLTGNNREGETVFAASLNESTHGEVVNEEIRVHNVTKGGHIILVRTKETSNVSLNPSIGENGLELNGHGENLIASRTTIGGIEDTTALPELTVTLPNIVSTIGGHAETTTSIPITKIPVHKNELKIEVDNSGSAVISKTEVEGSGQGSLEDGDRLKQKNGGDESATPVPAESSTEPGHITVRITTAGEAESEKTGLEIVPDAGLGDVTVTDVHVRGPLSNDELKTENGTGKANAEKESETTESSTGSGDLISGGNFENASGSIIIVANGTGSLPTGELTVSAGNITLPSGILENGQATGENPKNPESGSESLILAPKPGSGLNGQDGEIPNVGKETGKPKDDRKIIASGGSFNKTTGGIVTTIVGNGSIPTGTITIPGHVLINGTLAPTSSSTTAESGHPGLNRATETKGTSETSEPTNTENPKTSESGSKPTDSTITGPTESSGKLANGEKPLLVLEPTDTGSGAGVDHIIPTPGITPGAGIGTEDKPKITSGGSFNQSSGGILLPSGGNVTVPNGITLSAGNITIPNGILPNPSNLTGPVSPTDGIEIKKEGSSGILETGSGGVLNKTETTVIFKPVEPTDQTDVTQAGSNELGLEIIGHPSSTTSGEVGLEISLAGSTEIPTTEQPIEGSAVVPKIGDRQPITHVEEGSGEKEGTTKKPSTDVHDGTEVESKETDEGHRTKSTPKPNTDIHDGEGTESEGVDKGTQGSTTVGTTVEPPTATETTTTHRGKIIKIISSAEEKPKPETDGGELTETITGDHDQHFIKIKTTTESSSTTTTTAGSTTLESVGTTDETTQETGLEIVADKKTTKSGILESSTTKSEERSTKPAEGSTSLPGTTQTTDVEGSGETTVISETVNSSEKPTAVTTQETTAETGLENTTSSKGVTVITNTGSSGSTFEISSGSVTASTPSGTTEKVTGETGLEIVGKTTPTEKVAESSTTSEGVTTVIETGSSGGTIEKSSGTLTSSTPNGTTEQVTGEIGLEIVGKTTTTPTGPTSSKEYTTSSGTTLSTTETTTPASNDKSTPEPSKENKTPTVTEVTVEVTSSTTISVTSETTTAEGPFVSGLEIIGGTKPTTVPTTITTSTTSNHSIAVDEGEGSGEATVDRTTAKPKTTTEDLVLSGGRTTVSPNGTVETTSTPTEAASLSSKTPSKIESGSSIVPTTDGSTTTEHPNPTGSTPNFEKTDETTKAPLAGTSIAPKDNKAEETTAEASVIPTTSGTTAIPSVTNKTSEVTESTTPVATTISTSGSTPVKNTASTLSVTPTGETESTTSSTVAQTTAGLENNSTTSSSPVSTVSKTSIGTTATVIEISTVSPAEEAVTPTTVRPVNVSSSTTSPSKVTNTGTTVSSANKAETTESSDKPSLSTSQPANGTEATTVNPASSTGESSNNNETTIKPSETTSKVPEATTSLAGPTTSGFGVTSAPSSQTVEASTNPTSVSPVTGSEVTSSPTLSSPTSASQSGATKTPESTSAPVTAGGKIELLPSSTTGATTPAATGSIATTEPTDADMTSPKTEIDDREDVTRDPSDSAVTKQNRKPTDLPTEPPLQVTTLEETSSPLTATLSTKDTFALPSSSTIEPETLAPGNTTKCRSGDECGDDAQCERRTGACRCYPGFEGAPPQKPCQDVDECAEGLHNCHPSSRCHNFVGGYACFCPMGYRKNDKGICEDINECAESRGACCSANGTCVNKEGSYGCECKSGFTGDGYLCLPLEKRTCNESEQKTASCEKNHICMVDGQGKTDCDTCNMGYKMIEGKCIDINECSEAHLNMCDKNANCNNLMGTYGCECKEGFRGDGFMCEDIDECLRSPCHPQAECKNAPGTFNCTCPEGFVGDGIKECTNPLEKSCEDVEKFCGRTNHTACLSVRVFDGSLTSVCECEPNYRLNPDNNECEDIDECAENRHNCDPSSSHCVNQDGGFKCECSEGYEGRGGVCVDVDECERGLAGCHSNAMCLNQPGSCGCKCRKGFTGDGIQCNSMTPEPVDNSCTQEWQRLCRLENKTCHIDEEDVPQCGSCIEGHHPLNGSCQPQQGTGNCADPSKNNCDVNAECIDVHPGRHFCSCKVGYIGDGMRCDDIDECSLAGICDPNAACKNLEGSFECACLPGYLGNGFKCIKEPGPNCHLDTKLCHSQAFCATDGSCKCNEGLEGDGINNCTVATSSTALAAKDLTTAAPITSTGPIGPTNPSQSHQNETATLKTLMS